MSFSFPKTNRLRKRQQFKRLLHSTHRFVGRWINIDCRSNNSSTTRVGITVTKRFGKAHDRNRFKRIVREGFRLCFNDLPPGFDLNVKPRTEAHNASTQDVINEFLLFKTQKLEKPEKPADQ